MRPRFGAVRCDAYERPVDVNSQTQYGENQKRVRVVTVQCRPFLTFKRWLERSTLVIGPLPKSFVVIEHEINWYITCQADLVGPHVDGQLVYYIFLFVFM